MTKTSITLIAVTAVIVLWGFGGYNSLVTLNENADAQWAGAVFHTSDMSGDMAFVY